MTITEKHKIMDEISRVLDHFIVPEAPPTPKADGVPEMLTIKELRNSSKAYRTKPSDSSLSARKFPRSERDRVSAENS